MTATVEKTTVDTIKASFNGRLLRLRLPTHAELDVKTFKQTVNQYVGWQTLWMAVQPGGREAVKEVNRLQALQAAALQWAAEMARAYCRSCVESIDGDPAPIDLRDEVFKEVTDENAFLYHDLIGKLHNEFTERASLGN